MRKTRTTELIAVLAALACGAAAEAQQADDANRPNILLVIADDVGLDVNTTMYPGLIDDLLAQYGPDGLNHPGYRSIEGRPASTPALDNLARQGMRFTNVWAHPFCSPTRAAIITGLFAAETKVVNYQNPLADSHTSFVQKLRDDGGYSTGMFGKWHLAGLGGGGGRGARAGGAAAAPSFDGMTPKEAGFDIFRGHMGAAIRTFWDYDYQVQEAATPADQILTRTPPERSLPGIDATTFAPVVKIADAIELISAHESEDPDRPWFAWVAYNLSHATSGRAPAQMAVPNADTLDAVSRREMEECGGVFGTQDTGNCSGESQMRAMTNALDTTLGILLDAVDSLDPNTYVIYVGDNGTPMYGRPGLDFIDNMYITRTGRGKGTVYESGARVAMVVRGPNVEASSVSNAYAHVVDIYSTALSLAGLEVPARVSNSDGSAMIPLDGKSLGPVLFDGATAVRDRNQGYILTETEDLMRGGIREVGARNADFKVLCTESTDDCSFYNVTEDPLEEYPLEMPADCTGYRDGSWNADDASWHYCRLTEVVATKSFVR
jgi:arylsulfatase A-like enzyme